MSERAGPDQAGLLGIIEELLGQLDGTAVVECELRAGDYRVFVRRSPSSVTVAPLAQDETEGVPSNWLAIAAPLTGIFYRAELPQSPPFVSVDGPVSVGQVVGQIESMKMYNPVESEVSGIVRAIAVGNGAVVEKGQVLMYVEPRGEPA